MRISWDSMPLVDLFWAYSALGLGSVVGRLLFLLVALQAFSGLTEVAGADNVVTVEDGAGLPPPNLLDDSGVVGERD